MISCEKAASICNKIQYKEASFIEKMTLYVHIFLCKACKAFTKKNTELTSLCKNANLHSLTESQKLEMKENLKTGDSHSTT